MSQLSDFKSELCNTEQPFDIQYNMNRRYLEFVDLGSYPYHYIFNNIILSDLYDIVYDIMI